MRKFTVIMTCIGVILIAAQLALFDYSNWNSSDNWGGLAAILSLLLSLIILWNQKQGKEDESS